MRYDALKSRWTSDQCLGTPASPAEVMNWETAHGLSLPEDFRTCLLELNGTDDDGDRELYTFYPLSKLQSWKESGWQVNGDAPKSFKPEDWLVFCDYLVSCYAYAIYVGSDETKRSHIAICGGFTYTEVAHSFQTFIELYLTDSPEIYPQPSTSGIALAAEDNLFRSHQKATWFDRLKDHLRGRRPS